MRVSKRTVAVAASILAVMVAFVVVTRTFVYDLLVVKGNSMNETFRHNDRIVVNKLAYRSRKPEIGDIIAFNAYPNRIFVKRVVGVPGDLIEVKNGMLYRNGQKVVDEPYVTFHTVGRKRRSRKPRTIQHNHLFVMGDNRAVSVDSRDFGPITYESVIGEAIFIYYPPSRMGRIP
jgi:signal peptidase I